MALREGTMKLGTIKKILKEECPGCEDYMEVVAKDMYGDVKPIAHLTFKPYFHKKKTGETVTKVLLEYGFRLKG